MGKLKGTLSKSQQAQNRRAGLKQLWIDGSFQPHGDTLLAGGAAVLVDVSGKMLHAYAFQFDAQDASAPLHESRDAETLIAAVALETAPPGSIGWLYSDCMEVVPRLLELRQGTLNRSKFTSPVFDRIEAALQRHPSLHIEYAQRAFGRMPVANAFAQSAARGDIEKLQAESRRFRVPFSFVKATP